MNLRAKNAVLLLLMVPFLLQRGGAAQTPTAQHIFETNQSEGLKLYVELKRGDTVQKVTPQTNFHTGDLIKLHFTTNFNGYVYALNETPSGKTLLLFPTEEAGTANQVHAGADYAIPATSGWFKFAGEPGIEKIHILASNSPLSEVEARYRLNQGAPAAPAPNRANATLQQGAVPGNQSSGGAPSAPAVAAASPTPQSGAMPQPSPAATSKQNALQQGAKQVSSAQSGVQKDVGKVKGGISMTKTITSMPKDVVSIFKGIRPRDLVLENDEQEGASYISSVNSVTGKTLYFTVELVHQ